ncbi:hypothetical protein HK100_001996, partial [Physocladia obscura]
MQVSVISTQLSADGEFSGPSRERGEWIVVEGAVRISLPLAMHAQSRINREELKPLALEAVLVGKAAATGAFFFSSAPSVLWASSATSASADAAFASYADAQGPGSNRRDNVWSFISDVSTGNEDYTLDADFNENDRIFDTALKAGATYMQFPFRFRIPASLPPSLPTTPASTTSPTVPEITSSSCPQCSAILDQQHQQDAIIPGLVRFPVYEVMAMLSFESFAVSAYQVVSAPIKLSRSISFVPSDFYANDGLVAAGAFRYSLWDAPKFHILGSNRPYEFNLALSAGTIDLGKISAINIRPVYRYRHISAPDYPVQNQSHLFTPYQHSTALPSRTLTLSSTASNAQTLHIQLPPASMDKIPFPTAPNLGSWNLENSIEIAITFREHSGNALNGSLGRIIKPAHYHHTHHSDVGVVNLPDGSSSGGSNSGVSKIGFISIPLVVVQQYAKPFISSEAIVPRFDETDEELRRRDLELLMDRVDQYGTEVEGTLSCLFSAKKLVRIGLKDWVDAGTDDEAQANGNNSHQEDNSSVGGAVATYRSDAKPKNTAGSGGSGLVIPLPTSSSTPVPGSLPPLPPQQNSPPSQQQPAPIATPFIPARTVSSIRVPLELAGTQQQQQQQYGLPLLPASSPPQPQSPIALVTPSSSVAPSPSIPKRSDSGAVAHLLMTEKSLPDVRRKSIAESLNLTELDTSLPPQMPMPPSPMLYQQQQQQQQQAPLIPKRTNSQRRRPSISTAANQKVATNTNRDSRRIFVQPPRVVGLPQPPLPLAPSANAAATTRSRDLPPIPTPQPPPPAVYLAPPAFRVASAISAQSAFSPLDYNSYTNESNFGGAGAVEEEFPDDDVGGGGGTKYEYSQIQIGDQAAAALAAAEAAVYAMKRNNVTFNDEIQEFSAKSYQYTESSSSDLSNEATDAYAVQQMREQMMRQRSSMVLPYHQQQQQQKQLQLQQQQQQQQQQQLQQMQQLQLQDDEDDVRRMSLGTEMVNEILGQSTGENLEIELETERQLSMVP